VKTEVKNKRITILGAARSGIAAAKLLKKHGAKVYVSDAAPAENKMKEAAELDKAGIAYEFGMHSEQSLLAELVVLSPGIPVRSDVVQSFIKRKVPVLSEIEVAWWFCQSPVIAVTGSNGKTTTTTLIGEMLKKKYPQAIVAGNIGAAFSEYVDESDPHSWAVVEVSSFQLETIDDFHPKQAVVLNFAPNHLNRYDGYEDYLKAKWRLTKNLNKDDILIYNAADAKLTGWAERVECNLQGFDINGVKDHAAYYINDAIYINDKKLAAAEKIALRGKHNYMNVMAAALAAMNAGISAEQIREVLGSFTGVEHRLEFVTKKKGVTFINDSKATTVESLGYALQSFAEPIILITGGQDKGSDFTKLIDLIKANVKAIVLIGSSAGIMEKAWQGLVPIYKENSLQNAVNKAVDLAETNNTVLLSPACASFDMFRDYEDRGRQFKQIVQEVKVP
jgi:UDP-N-acetylmuramoylalanine--D-glutamate ligase